MTRIPARSAALVSGQAPLLAPVRMTEADLQRAVMGLLTALGWDYKFHQSQAFHASDRGWPDVFAARVRDRRILFAELKGEGKELRPRQVEVMDILRGVAFDRDAFVGLVEGFAGRRLTAAGRLMPTRVDVVVWHPEDWRTGEIERVLR